MTDMDPYAVLGVRPGADRATLRRAYRRCVRRAHPDAGGSRQTFERVQAAYSLLAARARPDRPGHAGAGAEAGDGGPALVARPTTTPWAFRATGPARTWTRQVVEEPAARRVGPVAVPSFADVLAETLRRTP